MTPKPKKHKQRFEHFVVLVFDPYEIQKNLEKLEKEGWELVNAILDDKEIANWRYTLFLKRPV